MKRLEKREWIAVVSGIIVVMIVFFGGTLWNTLTGSNAADKTEDTTPVENTTTVMKNISTTKGLEIYDELVGTGTVAVVGKTVITHYVGTLTNGTKFDSSLDRKTPFEFPLGGGRVIPGWDIGIIGMQVGGVRRLVISPELAYGSQPIGSIPANSTLIFEIALLGVK